MSSILRSSKFVRCFAGFARNLINNSSQITVNGAPIKNIVICNQNLARSLATQAPNTQSQFNTSLEKTLHQLDQDVRRVGRISRRDIEEVLEEIRVSRTASSSQSLLVIRCCGNLVPEETPEVRTKLVDEIWTTLEKLKVPMDISHYNALLRVYLENEHQFSPAKFLEDLERKGVEPNRVTYQRLITRYCQQGDIEGATKILEFMREKNLPVNESVFNALMMGHCHADDMESAEGILGVMRQAGLEPSADTYTTLLCGHARRGDITSIRKVLEECDAKDIYLLDKDHMDIVYTLAKHGHAQHVDEVIARMRKAMGYNQDVVHLILRLVNQGQEEVAWKMLVTMTRPTRSDDPSPFNTGNFFIKHLLKANRPVSVVLDVCNRLEKEGLHNKALVVALEASLTSGNTEQACALLEALRETGFPIRQHYFWPLLCAAGKLKNDQKVEEVVRQMTHFNLRPSSETVRDYILPNLKEKDSNRIISIMRGLDVSPGITVNALVHTLLVQGKLKEAAEVAPLYRAYYVPIMLRRPLIEAYKRTSDVNSLVSIIHSIHAGLDTHTSAADDNEGSQEFVRDKREVVGQFVLDLVKVLPRHGSSDLQPILEGLLSRGLGISSRTAELVQTMLSGENLTNEISALLERLASDDLEPQEAPRRTTSTFTSQPMDEQALKRRIAQAEERGLPTMGLKRGILGLYFHNKDVPNAEKIFQEIASESQIGVYAQMLQLYSETDAVDKALECYNAIRKNFSDTALDPPKMVRLACALIKADRTEEALKILDSMRIAEGKDWSQSFSLKSACYQMLNALAEKGDINEMKQVFDHLVRAQVVEVTNVMLGPLVKVHLQKDDIEGALKEFEECCHKYKVTPWKAELTRKLILKEDAQALQKLTDLSTKVHGEVNSLYDLVFSFVDCGRIRQARKILETPGLYNRPKRLSNICERYRQEGSVAALEGLVEATRDITHIDRSEIFKHLLLTYVSAKDTEKALGLWTQMQDEDISPTDEFLVHLATFLQNEGRPVPFVVPVLAEKPEMPKAEVEEPTTVTSKLIGLRNAIRMKQMDEALRIFKSLDNSLNSSDTTALLEGLCQTGRIGDAHRIAVPALQKKAKLSPRTVRFYMNKLSAVGEVEKMEELGKILDSNQKKLYSYDNRLCNAFLTKGRGPEYLEILCKDLEEAKPEDIKALEEKFPRGAILGLLSKHPELIPKYQQLAVLYKEKGSDGPVNSLWVAFFLTPELQDKADSVWQQHLSKSPRVMFQKVLRECRLTADDRLVKKLTETFKDSAMNNSARGLVYSCLLDILVGKGKAEEALAELQKALDHVSLEDMNTSALLRVKGAVETQGKTFPYTIPLKGAKDSSSSESSSDDEAKPKTEAK